MAQKYVALIPCAGNGSRFGGEVPKQYVNVAVLPKTILEYTLEAFINTELIGEIIVIVNPNDQFIDDIIYKINNPKVTVKKVGGATRAESVLNGLNELYLNEYDWVLVHDAARCRITSALIEKQIEELKDDPVGGILAIPVTDTVKYVQDNVIMETLDRSQIFLAQTPQMFRFGLLKACLERADLTVVTDEASSVEYSGKTVKIVMGSPDNIKITVPDDIKKLYSF